MMTCPDCTKALDDVPVGEPCPKCGSLRRNATVSVPTIEAMARLFPSIVFASIDALIAVPEVRQVVESREITLRFTPPSDQETRWLLEARDGDELIAFAPGPKLDDTYLATAEEIEAAVRPPQVPDEPPD